MATGAADLGHVVDSGPQRAESTDTNWMHSSAVSATGGGDAGQWRGGQDGAGRVLVVEIEQGRPQPIHGGGDRGQPGVERGGGQQLDHGQPLYGAGLGGAGTWLAGQASGPLGQRSWVQS